MTAVPGNCREVSEYLTLRMVDDEFPALGRRYVRRLVAERRIRYFKPNGPKGRTLVRRQDIESFIASGAHEPIGTPPSAQSHLAAPA